MREMQHQTNLNYLVKFSPDEDLKIYADMIETN